MGCNRAMTGAGSVLLALATSVAAAQVTEYTDQSAFDAVTSHSNFSFDAVAAPGSFTSGDVSYGGLSFTVGGSNVGFLFGSGTVPFYGGSAFFSGLSINPGIDPAEVVCTLPGSTAIGFNFGDYADGGGSPFTVSLSTGHTFSFSTPPQPGLDIGFIGFTSSTPITSVTFSNGDGYGIDLIQVSSGSPVGVPEPGSLALLATGLVCLALVSRGRALKVQRSS